MKNKTFNFVKMSGAGNDFVMVQPVAGVNFKKITPRVCDRTNGIGADGIITVERGKKTDYQMRIINSDGSEAEMCGNGARCFAAYVVRYLKPKKKQFTFETLAGTIIGEAKDEIAVVRLSDPTDYHPNVDVRINDRILHVSSIDTGVPHAVVFVDDLAKIDVNGIGPQVRYHDVFKPRGTNVNFVEQINPHLVAARTYERGVEGETKACGTGSVASAIITYLRANPGITQKKNATMNVRTTGGEILTVTFDIASNKISNVWLKGSARFVAKGEYFL